MCGTAVDGVKDPGLRRLVAALSEPETSGRLTRPAVPRAEVPKLRVRTARRRAAVLLLVADTGTPDVTFIERAVTLRHHPGQIAFPGGGIDEGETVVEAALREAHEEIRLHPSAVTPLVSVPAAIVTVSAYNVDVVVASWDGRAEVGPGDPAEVASVHRYAISDLVDPRNRALATLPGGYRGPAFLMGDIFIWGFTANLLSHALELGGWARPWDPDRLVPVPERFARDAARGAGSARTWVDETRQ